MFLNKITNALHSTPLIGFFSVLIIWQIIYSLQILHGLLFPSPIEVLTQLASLFTSGTILHDLFSTIVKLIIAIIVGSSTGFVIGVILSRWTFIYDTFSPTLDFFRSIPATALFPLFLIIFGVGDYTNTTLTIWICAIYLALHVAKGLRSTSEDYLILAKSLRKSTIEIFFKVQLMEALPTIFLGLRTAISLTVAVLIVTEMFIGTTQGLGKALIDSAYTYNIANLYAIIILVGILGYLLNNLIEIVERKIVHWEGK